MSSYSTFKPFSSFLGDYLTFTPSVESFKEVSLAILITANTKVS